MTYIVGALVVAAFLLGFWAVFVERRLFRVRRVVLDADSLGLPELKILHVTDTHFHGHDEAILSFLRKLSEREEFDLVFFTGDLLDTPQGMGSAERAAALFRPRLGSFAVLGGHDYVHIGAVETYACLLRRRRPQIPRTHGLADELVQRLKERGVCVIEDANVQLAGPDGGPFAVVGLRDACAFAPDFDAAWAGIPSDLAVIVIAHSPDVLADACARRARLAFFGHTHGGQVRFPLIGAVVTRADLPRRLASGTFRRGGTIFAVSNGLGTARAAPYRLLCRPEVTVAQLRRSAPAEALTALQEAGPSSNSGQSTIDKGCGSG